MRPGEAFAQSIERSFNVGVQRRRSRPLQRLVRQFLTEVTQSHTIGTYIPEVASMSQDEKVKQIHIKLEANLHQALKLEAALCNQTIQELVVQIIEQRISRSEFAGFLNNGE